MSDNAARRIGGTAREASAQLRVLGTAKKNQVLATLAADLDSLRQAIKEENLKDLAAAEKSGLSSAMMDRLEITDRAIDGMISSLEVIRKLDDPVGLLEEGKILPNGLKLLKRRIPLGVVAVIYESRPNVTIDVAALGLKSGNATILRGGKEAIHSNRMLAARFRHALKHSGVNPDAVQYIDNPDRDLARELMLQDDLIDLVVPRGGEGLIRFVSENSRVPVVKHDKGVCHAYIAASAEPEMAAAIVVNAKASKPSVCNAIETILFDRNFPESAAILSALKASGVKFFGDEDTVQEMKKLGFEASNLMSEGYSTEYLEKSVSLKLVSGADEAVGHIRKFGTNHSEIIVSSDFDEISRFESSLDSAAVFINCSSRFHDGGEFGYGAEVGIATGKLHCRGPMGLRDLTTFQFVVTGNGQIRG